MSIQAKSPQQWAMEYELFLKTTPVEPPSYVSQGILSKIHHRLHPSLGKVFLKLLATHSVIATLILLVCPHFGLQIIPEFGGLSGLLMKINHTLCMTVCGFLFFAPSLLTVTLTFQAEYLKAVARLKGPQVPMLIALSLIVLHLIGGEPFLWQHVLPWLFGALCGSFLALGIGLKGAILKPQWNK